MDHLFCLISPSDRVNVLAVFIANHSGCEEKKNLVVFEAKTKSLSKFLDARGGSYVSS